MKPIMSSIVEKIETIEMNEVVFNEIVEIVHDSIDVWHDSNSSLSIFEWLGMTWEEYGLFVESDENLKVIIENRLNSCETCDLPKNKECRRCLGEEFWKRNKK